MKTMTLVGLLLGLTGLAQAEAPLRRFALLAGANDGGSERVKLRYAVTDAHALGDVLGQLGGVASEDRLLVTEPDPAALDAAFIEMSRRLAAARAAGDRVELLFYYSGHSDDQGLLLGGKRIGYSDLRRQVDALPADVRIAIVDACASGALTRTKGGKRRPPFLMDSAVKVRGYAILTSASADESAQESDRVGGSFFTHALLTGLRGAADATGDGRVTLNEAYQYAYHETLARTEQTRLGAQHPSYDLNLSGQGDVVLTDVRSTGAGLILGEGLTGRLYVRDLQGKLVAELNKPAGRAMELGFAPGTYRITLDQAGALSRTEIALAEGAHTPLDPAAFQHVEGEVAVGRGAAPIEESVQTAHIGIVPGLDTTVGEHVVNRVALNLFVGMGWGVDGVEVAGIGNIRASNVRGLQAAGTFNSVGGNLVGAQAAGVFGNIEGRFRGLQAAGVFNLAGGPGRGLQAAGIFNAVGDTHTGMQAGGVGNMAAGRVEGVQVGGIFNAAPGHKGAQIAGISNVSEKFEGVQIGLVNIADQADGVQIGLVNIASTMRGAPIGLVNIIGDGIHEVELGATDVSPAQLTVRLGSQWFYTTLTGGARFTDQLYFAGAGLGGRFSINGDWSLDLGVTSQQFYDAEAGFNDDLDLLNRATLTAGWRLSDDLQLVFGPAVNVLVSRVRDGEDLAFGLGSLRTEGDVNVRVWPGAQVGLVLF